MNVHNTGRLPGAVSTGDGTRTRCAVVSASAAHNLVLTFEWAVVPAAGETQGQASLLL